MKSSGRIFDSFTVLCLISTLEVSCCAGELLFIRAPHNTTVKLDQRFRYYCQVSNPGPFSVKWFHNGDEMSRVGQNYKIKKDGTLRFTKVKVVNRGRYQCKVENSFRDVGESPLAYLTVHAPAVIINKNLISRPRLAFVGSVVQITCEVAGIPMPVIQWRKNGNLILKNQSNPRENQTEHDTSDVSISSTLRITVFQSAWYSCSALNFPLGKQANDSIIINVTAIETAGPTDASTKEPMFCTPYNGTTCKDYLQGRMVVTGTSLQEADAELEAHLKYIDNLGLFSGNKGNINKCEGPARRLLCHMTFPDCHNETAQAVPICQESCRAVKSVFCFHELVHLDDMQLKEQINQSIGLLSLPDCLTLPSKYDDSHTCVESNHHDFHPVKVTDDCYVEKGRWYNGTVQTTKSGHTCQAWVDNSPHKHDRSPLIFPELQKSENFCRNPGGEEDRPWCYTTYTKLRWEVCDINPCELIEEDGNNASPADDDDEDEDDLNLLYIVGACVLVTVCFVAGILCFLLRYCRHARYSATAQDELDINVDSLPINSAYHQMKSNRLNPKLETLEFPRNDIVFIEDIGQGAFGRVFKARIVCSNGNSHITGGKLSGSKHSLTCGKNCKHSKNTFSSKGDLRHLEIHASSKSCDSKLLWDHLPVSCDHDRDDRDLKFKGSQLIAIKMLKEDASETIQADFEREASLMVEFDHANIVRLLGVCTVGKPMCLLFEYMSKGDLNEYLRLCSPDQCLRRSNAGSTPSLEDSSSVTVLDQLHMARQIACGMIYLSERGYVHRDLATRNCLVGNNLTVKISDFGLARSVHSMDYYHGSDKDAIPVRWMPPEAILYNKFSSQSDVWSYGVLLWEIFSFALQPYYGMTHEEVINYLRAGKILASPENVPPAAYELMKTCWHKKPSSRPSFVFLHKSLSFMYEEVNRQQPKTGHIV